MTWALATMTSLSASGGGHAQARLIRSTPASTRGCWFCEAACTLAFSGAAISLKRKNPPGASLPPDGGPESIDGKICVIATRITPNWAALRQGRGEGEGMKATELMIGCLENEGVRYIFGIPGEENLDFMDSLSESDQITFVTTRHEQGAAFMANVYGRLSTYPGVCLATLGPGATNLVTGIADAQLDRAPLVAITGQAARRSAFKESHQSIDVVGLLRPVTKWNARIEEPTAIPEVVRKAFRLARLEKPGATHIELPEDVAEREVDARPLEVRRTTYARAGDDVVRKAAETIDAASRPVLLVGNGVIRREAARHGAVAALRRFVARTRIP